MFNTFIHIYTSWLILEIIKETTVKMYDKVLNTTNKKRITYITFDYLRKTTVNKKKLSQSSEKYFKTRDWKSKNVRVRAILNWNVSVIMMNMDKLNFSL